MATTPALASPRAKALPSRATRTGSAPIARFVSCMKPRSARSKTGPRLVLSPSAFMSSPARRPHASDSHEPSAPRSRAGGSAPSVGTDRRRLRSPPSRSTEIRSGIRARRCSASTRARIASGSRRILPRRMTPPRSIGPSPPGGYATTTCPTFSSRVIAARVRSARSGPTRSGAAGAGSPATGAARATAVRRGRNIPPPSLHVRTGEASAHPSSPRVDASPSHSLLSAAPMSDTVTLGAPRLRATVEPPSPHAPAARKVFVHTFGCQMNESDSARMVEMLGRHAFSPAASVEEADLILLNTCAVREKAEQKLFSALGRYREVKARRGALIAVAGCIAQQEKERLLKRVPYVDFVFGPDNMARLPEMIDRAYARERFAATRGVDPPEDGFPRADAGAARGR